MTNRPSTHRAFVQAVIACIVLVLLQGCAATRITKNLPYGMLDNDDPQLVAQALPGYMVTVDGLLANWPDNADLLRTASSLSAAYVTLNLGDLPRAKRYSARSLDYAFRAACAQEEDACNLRAQEFTAFEGVLAKMDEDNLPMLFTLGSAWAGYVQQHSDDWAAIAELARVQKVFERIIGINAAYENGMPQLYLGVMNSLLPPSLGGKPEVAKTYYEESIRLSGGHNLYAKMMYAKQYARLLYDRDLHDRLLNEVLAADPHSHGLTLANVFAQEEAKRLLASADDYF